MGLIVVVEDQPGVRETIRLWLSVEGHQVVSADDAESALQWFEREKTRPDLALIDIKLPGMTGFSLADALMKDYLFDDIAFMTGFIWEEETMAELSRRGKPWFEKPLSFQDKLLPFINQYLNKGA